MRNGGIKKHNMKTVKSYIIEGKIVGNGKQWDKQKLFKFVQTKLHLWEDWKQKH